MTRTKKNCCAKPWGQFHFSMILNQFRKTNDISLGEKIKIVCNRHFYSVFEFLGNISYDDRVHDSVNLKKLYVTKYPYTETATDLKSIARKLIEGTGIPEAISPAPVGSKDHLAFQATLDTGYDLLRHRQVSLT